jgi:hypothetical protein
LISLSIIGRAASGLTKILVSIMVIGVFFAFGQMSLKLSDMSDSCYRTSISFSSAGQIKLPFRKVVVNEKEFLQHEIKTGL